MKSTNQGLIVVTGNVYYCKFGEAPDPEVLRACVLSVAHDIRNAVSGMQVILREVQACADQLAETDANGATALRELANAVDEMAFHAHIAAVDCERGGVTLETAQELRQMARGGVAAAGDLREWALQSLGRAQNATRLLMDIARRVHAAAHSLQDQVAQSHDDAQPAH